MGGRRARRGFKAALVALVCAAIALGAGPAYAGLFGNTPPIAVVTATPNPAHAGDTVHLFGTSSSDAETPASQLTYAWDFGDGTTEAGAVGAFTADHVYVRGVYTVTLTVTDPGGKSDTDQVVINVDDTAPTAAATATPKTVAVSHDVQFDASGSSDAETPDAGLTYTWDFGDSSSGSGMTPTHSYTTAGTYVVKLIVKDPDGATASTTVSVTVTNTAPTSSWTMSPTSPHTGQVVSFDGSASTDAETPSSLTYDWDFGDGTAHATTAKATHTYATNGFKTVKLKVTDPQGLSDTRSVLITVGSNRAPVAVATATQSKANVGQSVGFDGSGSSDAETPTDQLTYDWNFGDGTTHASTMKTSHAFAAPGTYTVTLSVSDPDGHTATATVSVTVGNDAPVANAVATPSTAHALQQVSFDASTSTDAETPDQLTYSWTFGDGSAATAYSSNPVAKHAYAAAGTYTVTIRVKDVEGAVGTKTITEKVLANGAPVAKATATPNPVHVGKPVSFSGTGSTDPDGDPITYSWSFPGGGTANTATTQHTFGAVGSYDVTLTVTDQYGVTDTDTVTVQVTNNAPVANAVATPNPVHVGKPVSFSGTGSTDPDGDSISSYHWEFPGGATADTATAQHTFGTVGSYDVTLTVTDQYGVTDTDTVTVQVTNNAPVANAVATPNPAHVGKPISFSGTGSTDPDGDAITSYHWDFPGGSVADTATTQHTFGAVGSYQVKLTVTDSYGVSDTDTITVVVGNNAPVAKATATPNPVHVGKPVTFSGTQTSDPDGDAIASYHWDFPGGATADTSTAQHTFDTVGSYQVTLTVTDQYGLTDTDTITVVVTNTAPVAQATVAPNPVHVGSPVTLDASGSTDPDGDAIASYEWSYAGQNTFGPTLSLTFNTFGTKTITLTVTDDHGAQTQKAVAVNVVDDAPRATFTAPTGLLLVGSSVVLDARGSTDTETPGNLTYSWSLGDGTTATGSVVHHGFGLGSHLVKLTVTDPQGRSATYSRTITMASLLPCQNSAVNRTSQWRSVRNAAARGGTYCDNLRGGKGGGTLSVTMTGPSFGLTFARSSAGGRAQIYVDGVLKGRVLFSGSGPITFGYRKIINGLSSGRHQILIKFTGAGYVDDLYVFGAYS